MLWESVILACLRYLGDTGNLGRERVQFYMIFFNPAEPKIKKVFVLVVWVLLLFSLLDRDKI
jgi:hypothetical protein